MINLFSDTPSFGKDKMTPLRAVLAVLIVADHLTYHVDLGWLRPFRELGAPIVSVFFFISGYGLLKQYLFRGKSYLSGFGKKRIWKVILPALIALALYWLIDFDASRKYFVDIKNLFVYGYPLLPYSWYVAAIVYFYAAFWVSFSSGSDKFAAPLLWAHTIVFLFGTKALGYDRCWWVCSLAFPTGATVAKYEKELYGIVFKSGVRYLTALAVVIAAALALYLTGNEYAFCLCYIFIPVLVYLCVCKLRLDKFNGPVIAFIGGISYEIYLCQGVAMEFFRGDKLFVGSNCLYIFLVYAFVIVLAYSVNAIASKLPLLKISKS